MMLALALLMKGAVLGFSIAAPVGPIGILCIRRTMASGRTSGLVSGMGASCVHAFYGAVGAFGLTALSTFLFHAGFWLKLFGGSFLIYLGISIFLSQLKDRSSQDTSKESLIKHFLSTLLLSITNPMTLLSFLAIFASLEIATDGGHPYGPATLFVVGVFFGSLSWWTTLSYLISRFQRKIDDKTLKWINRISGTVIVLFGTMSLYSLL